MTTELKGNYEAVDNNFTNHQIAFKRNAYQTNWQCATLLDALIYCENSEHQLHCKQLASLMYDIDPDYGLFDEDKLKIVWKDKEDYQSYRRSHLKLVKYFTNDQIGLNNGFVILDIDFKKISELFRDQLENLKAKIISYFEQHNASVFLVESSSGMGFHIAMSFHSESINNKLYQKAYSYYAYEIGEITGIENFISYVDFSVSHIDANFFIGKSSTGLNGLVRIKNPTQSLKVVFEENEIVHEITNEFTLESYHADFLLSHYSNHIPKDCKAFNDYDTWNNMIFALIVTFQKNKDRAYYWFEKFSQLAEDGKINKEENDEAFERIFDWQPDAEIGINYILKEIFGTGNFRNFITYSFNDVKNYFEANHKFLQQNDTPITEFFDKKYTINNYISEQRDVLAENKNIMLIAPPNSGKSTFYMSLPNVILLTPTSILRDDLCTNNPETSKIQAGEDITPNQLSYIGNYDAIYKIINSKLNLKNYTLIIDESQELFFSAHPNFRHPVVNKLVNSLSKFKNFVLLTGTPFQFRLSEDKFETYYFVKKENRKPQLEIVSTSKPLQTMAKEVLETNGKQICFINNKDIIAKVSDLIKDKQPNRNVIVFSSITKNDEEQQQILQMNQLPENTVVLGTQMILEGISFKDNDITHLRFYQPILAEYIAQFSFRPRDEENPPLMVMYTKPKDYKHQKDAFPTNSYRYLEKKYNKILENVKQHGIESEGFGLQLEGYYRRVTQFNTKNKIEFLPINLFNRDNYDIDLLFLGQLATERANKKLSIDLFTLLVQLQKWNFKFTFRQAEATNLLTIHCVDSRFKQAEIILNNFEGLIMQDKIEQTQKVLYPAWLLSKIINPNYFLNLGSQERLEFFTDDKTFKIAVLKLGVWAKENRLVNPHLSFLISKHQLNQLIDMVISIKHNGIEQEIAHETLMGMLMLPQNKIKETKAKLRLYFDILNRNNNGIRSVIMEHSDLSILDAILENEFEDEDASPF